jgi:hypothetical protein
MAPLVTLLSISLNNPSASLFYANATVMGAGLSVTKFFKAPLDTLLSISLNKPSASLF